MSKKKDIFYDPNKEDQPQKKNYPDGVKLKSNNNSHDARKKDMILDFLKLIYNRKDFNIEYSTVDKVVKSFIRNQAYREKVTQLDLIKHMLIALEEITPFFRISLMNLEGQLIENASDEDKYQIAKEKRGETEYRYAISTIADILNEHGYKTTRMTVNAHTLPEKGTNYIQLQSISLEGEKKSVRESTMVDYISLKLGKEMSGIINADFRNKYAYKAPMKE